MALRRGVAPIWPTIRLKFVVRIRVPVNLPISTELLLSARTSLRQRQIRVSTASLLEVTPVRVGQSVRTADVLLAVRILAASLRVAGGFLQIKPIQKEIHHPAKKRGGSPWGKDFYFETFFHKKTRFECGGSTKSRIKTRRFHYERGRSFE
jgi:hypothetical protein